MYADVKQLMKVVDANPEKGTVKSSFAMAVISFSLTIFIRGNFLSYHTLAYLHSLCTE